MKKKALILCNSEDLVNRVYAAGRLAQVRERVELYPTIVSEDNFDAHAENLADMEVVFSTWGMPKLSAPRLDKLPSLRIVLYAAGSVKEFAPSYLDRGVKVVSAWTANGIPVAEFTLAQILLSCKGYFQNARDCRDPEVRSAAKAHVGKGVFGETIALVGAGQIARHVIRFLKAFELKVMVVDPYLPDQEAEKLGVVKVTLERAFAEAYVVSNHLPNIPSTVGLLDGRLFASMRPGATFINTGRGAQVVEKDLIDVLKARPDLTALLDVTFPEPPDKNSPFYTLPNVQLSSHIAGSLGDEVVRMADYMIEEFDSYAAGRPLRYAVTQEMLVTMA